MKTQPIRYGGLVRTFLKVGATAFGGWSTTALLLEKEFADTKELTKRQVHTAVAYAQILPGATQIQIVSNIGYQLRGVRGACVAVASYVTPALILFLVFSVVYFRFLQGSQALEHLGGVSAALGGVMLANAYRIGKKHVSHPWMWMLIFTSATIRWMGCNPVIIVFVFGATAALLSFWNTKERKAHG
ncbi:MAG TPA: chromate transporter [Verrucomicrobiae bacterium]|nr:chromate transporter [Verrucomicrobiae bacterium]